MRALMAAIRTYDITVLCPNGFDCTLDAVPAGLLTGCPVIPTYGGMFNLPYPHPRLPLVNVFSDELMVDLIERFGWKRGEFRHLIARIDQERFSPGVSGAALRAELGIPEGAKVLVMICRHDELKRDGVMTLLDAAEGIHGGAPDARIVLLGDGNAHAEILARIEAIHARAGSRFILAPGSSQRTAEAFAMSDLVVATGARSALEGMACARPVLSVGPNGFCGVLSPETIEGFRRFNFDKGRLAGNPLASRQILVDCLLRLLTDDALRREVGRFSESYAREHLLIQTAAPAYQAMYMEALEKWPSGRLARLGLFAGWVGTVLRFLAYRLKRRFGLISAPPPEEVAPPPASLDPEWRVGIPASASPSPGG
jgi:glycosyltransferase involved in cell wall biosynthesis